MRRRGKLTRKQHFLCLLITATIVTAVMSLWEVFGFLLLVWCIVGLQANQLRWARGLRTARPGTIKMETVRASSVNGMLQDYRNMGWEVVAQSTAKSFGTQARVTVTLRKVAR